MKKRSLVFVFGILMAFLTLISTQSVLATSVDITSDVSIENMPKEVVVGESGKFKGEIEKIQGINVTGTINYRTSDSNILSTSSNGEWTAKASGEVTVTTLVTLSNESMQALKDKFPGDTLVTRDVASVFTIRVTKKSSSVYRIYNPNSGEHFYTENGTEVNNLKKAGWKDEGLGWFAPSSGSNVYRLYNPNAGDHHYTINLNEKNNLVKVGWKYEGVSWYSDNSKRKPLYRLYNPNAKKAGAHHYTPHKWERDNLKKAGWSDEGIGWWGV